MSLFGAANANTQLTQGANLLELQTSCSSTTVQSQAITLSNVTLENISGCNINLGNIQGTKLEPPSFECAQETSAKSVMDAISEANQKAKDISLSGNVSLSDVKSLSKIYVDQKCNNSILQQNQIAADNISFKNITCKDNTLNLFNISNTSLNAEQTKLKCQQSASAEASTTLKNIVRQVNEGFNPLAFLNTMAEGIKFAMIALVIGIVLAIVVVVVKKSSQKGEVAKCQKRKKEAQEKNNQNVQDNVQGNSEKPGTKPNPSKGKVTSTEDCSKVGSTGVKVSVIVMIVLILAVVGVGIYVGVTVNKQGNLCSSKTVTDAENELKSAMVNLKNQINKARTTTPKTGDPPVRIPYETC